MPFRAQRILTTIGYVLTLLIGLCIGWLLKGDTQTSGAATIIREPDGKYRFISPLIGFNPGEKEEFEEYFELEHILKDAIDLLKQEKKIHSASVYFRDMESGRWTGVNEDELYSPASLYKVALMIAVLKASEKDPLFLEEKLVFTNSRNAETPDHPPLIKGKAYSVRELLDRLITLSDNDAKNLLRDRIGLEAVSTVFNDLRLAEPKLEETGDSMSARTYSRFFRTLYNATYLSRELSEQALTLLSQVTFKSGILNGLPPEAQGLTVAHKFGYRVFPDPLDVVREELHDCGIVYVPEQPYFVCIMTKGFTQTDLMDAIQLL